MAKRKSRADRFADAMGQLDNVISDVEELKSELEEWRDNMPESLQGGQKHEELEEAIGQLEDLINGLQEGMDTEVNFPGMY